MPNNNITSILRGLVEEKRRAKADEDQARQMKNDEDRNYLMGVVTSDLKESLKPVLEDMAKNTRISADELRQAFNEAVSINVPEVKIPDIKIPNIQVPEIKIPNIKIPDITIPEIKMPKDMEIKGWINIMGYDRGLLNNPLPVQIRDADGKPVSLGGLTQVVSGGGGKADYFTIKGFSDSAYAGLMNADGRLKVSVETGGSAITDGELRASSVPVEQVSGSAWSVYVAGTTGSLAASLIDSSGIQYSGSNPLPVVFGASATQAVNMVDSSGIAYSGSNPVPVVFGASATQAVNIVDSSGVGYSGTNPVPVTGSVAVSGVTGSIGATILNGEGLARDSWVVSGVTASVQASIIDSSGIGYSGSNPVPMTWVSGTGGGVTTAATIVDSTGIQYSGSNPLPFTLATSNAINTVNARLVDSGGVGWCGSNPVPVYIVANTGSSTIAVGATVSDAVDDGSAPVKNGGIARTANPTAVAGGDRVSFSADDLGRQLTRPIQVRDLLLTAYVTEDEIGEVTLLAGVASEYHDLVYLMCANESSAAINLDFRQTTGGTVQMSVEVPANGTAGVSLPVPIPQDHADATWTVKNSASDNSNTVYSVTALFSKEV